VTVQSGVKMPTYKNQLPTAVMEAAKS